MVSPLPSVPDTCASSGSLKPAVLTALTTPIASRRLNELSATLASARVLTVNTAGAHRPSRDSTWGTRDRRRAASCRFRNAGTRQHRRGYRVGERNEEMNV